MSIQKAKTLLLKNIREWKKYCSKNRFYIWDIFNGDVKSDTFVFDDVKTQYIIREMEFQLYSSSTFLKFLVLLPKISIQNLERIYNSPIFNSLRLYNRLIFNDFKSMVEKQHPNSKILSKIEFALFREPIFRNDEHNTIEERIDEAFLQNAEWRVLDYILFDHSLNKSELKKLFNCYYEKMILFNPEKYVITGMVNYIREYWSKKDQDYNTPFVFIKWLKNKVNKKIFEENCYYLIETKMNKEMFVFLKDLLS